MKHVAYGLDVLFSFHFFKILRKANKFQWDEECDKAFQELKDYLSTLPVLAKPIVGETLWVYLSANENVVGSVLVRQEGKEQQPIYFSGHLLKGAECRYTTLEKLAYALVLTARRSHP